MRTLLIAMLALACTGPLGAAEDPYGEWFKHFYQTRDIAQFDGFWKWIVREKTLENKNAIPPTIGFASQVLHKYPALIKGRLDDPAALPKAQRDSILKLLWLSDTPEAREVLKKAGGKSPGEKPPPAIGTWEIATAGDLDFCWGWFFATGDTAALDRIISALDLGRYAGALKGYPASKKTEEDRQAAMKDAIFSAAMWSLGANGRENPDIAKHIRILFFDPQTPKSRQMWLGVIFTKVSPNISQRELESNKAGH